MTIIAKGKRPDREFKGGALGVLEAAPRVLKKPDEFWYLDVTLSAITNGLAQRPHRIAKRQKDGELLGRASSGILGGLRMMWEAEEAKQKAGR